MAENKIVEELPWHLEWIWVSGYSTIATLTIIFNMVLMFAIGKNRFLHFSFHYAIIAMGLRNILRVIQSCFIVSLSKLIQTHWLFKMIYQIPAETPITNDLTTSSGLPITCQVLCTADHFLMSLMMFYIATLAVYVFCRPAHPDSPGHYKKPYVNSEQCWVPTLVTLLPPLLSCLLSLPGPLLPSYHPISALPRTSLCQTQYQDTVTTYITSVSILGYVLPLAITICITMALMIRRCWACGRFRGRCCSSYCKEELSLVLISCLYTITQFAMYLPILDIYLERFDLPTSHGEIGEYLTPEISRLAENLSGLLFPLLLLCLLSGYRRFSSTPDPHDLSLDEDGVRAESEPPHHVTRLSQESFDLQLVARNGHLHDPMDDEDKIY